MKTYERWTRGIANPAYSYMAYKDHNGALYQDRDQIDKLSEAYDFIITEGRFDYGYFEMAEKVSQKAKGKPIMVSFVSGHGLPGSVDFGGSDYDEHTLDLSDIKRVRKIRAFDRNTVFIFFSCLTGAKVDGSKEVISQMVSRAKEAVAIAPRLSMYHGEIIITRGRVEKVIYSYTNPEDGTDIKEEGQVFVRGIRTNRVP